MSNTGSEFITRDGAELMMMQLLDEYEEKKVAPRHKETQADLKDIKTAQAVLMALLNKGRGIKDFAKQIPNVIALIWLIMQIFHSATKH